MSTFIAVREDDTWRVYRRGPFDLVTAFDISVRSSCLEVAVFARKEVGVQKKPPWDIFLDKNQ